VDGFGDEFFTGTGFAMNQNTGAIHQFTMNNFVVHVKAELRHRAAVTKDAECSGIGVVDNLGRLEGSVCASNGSLIGNCVVDARKGETHNRNRLAVKHPFHVATAARDLMRRIGRTASVQLHLNVNCHAAECGRNRRNSFSYLCSTSRCCSCDLGSC
ncbi:MAG: hypothetical protein RIR85_1144, partial [Pseudomonadota bacterium]